MGLYSGIGIKKGGNNAAVNIYFIRPVQMVNGENCPM
jgi:hypothetical protein